MYEDDFKGELIAESPEGPERSGGREDEGFYLNHTLTPSAAVVSQMKWVTREKAKVDRIACPWLITRFIDKKAEFLFVPKDRVQEVAKSDGAIPFDAPGVELTHYLEDGKEFVSFDAIMGKYKLNDPALRELAKIVRGADAKQREPAPESAGLEAAAVGFREISHDDFENMRNQFPLYDALYKHCQLMLGHTDT